MRLGLAMVAWMFAAIPAFAEDAPEPELVTKGKALAKSGAWSQAITTFKQADAQQPRAQNACFIGLAYLRRELWAQAELYFAKCHARATATDPVPEWTAEAEGQLADKLAHETVAAITLEVPVPNARIRVGGFLPDEDLAPGTVHLTPGRYTLTFEAAGYVTGTRELDIKDGTAQLVHVELAVAHPPPYRTSTGWYIAGAGVLAIVAGTVIDLTKLQSERDQLKLSQQRYDEHSGSFDTWRDVTVGCWIGGAVLTGVGVYLARRLHTPEVLVSMEPHGASFAIGWSR